MEDDVMIDHHNNVDTLAYGIGRSLTLPLESDSPKSALLQHKQISIKDSQDSSRKFGEALPNFNSMSLNDVILKNLKDSIPTPLQVAMIPKLMNERNVFAMIGDATGKYGAFLIPTLHKILPPHLNINPHPKKISAGPRVVIVTGSMTNAKQIKREADNLSTGTSIQTTVIGNCISLFNQTNNLPEEAAHVVIGSTDIPDSISTIKMMNLQLVRYLLVDEIDGIVDLGLMSFVEKILQVLWSQEPVIAIYGNTNEQVANKAAKQIFSGQAFISIQMAKPVEPIECENYNFQIPKNKKRCKLLEILRSEICLNNDIILYVHKTKKQNNLLAFLNSNNVSTKCWYLTVDESASPGPSAGKGATVTICTTIPDYDTTGIDCVVTYGDLGDLEESIFSNHTLAKKIYKICENDDLSSNDSYDNAIINTNFGTHGNHEKPVADDYAIFRSSSGKILHVVWDYFKVAELKPQGYIDKSTLIEQLFSSEGIKADEAIKILDRITKDELLIPINSKKGLKYKLPDITKIDRRYDWYCFRCHHGGVMVRCQSCSLVHHKNCLPAESDSKYTGDRAGSCPVCEMCKLKKLDGKSSSLQINELNKMITNMVTHYKKMDCQLWNTADPTSWAVTSRSSKQLWRFDALVHTPMDLTVISDKALNLGYNTLYEFQVDCDSLLHALGSYFESNSPIYKKFYSKVHQPLLKAIEEANLCEECYKCSMSKDPLWFCHPCNPPHKIVFAKMSRYPYWPAKILKKENEGFIVRFFGGNHEFGYVSETKVSKENPTEGKKGLKLSQAILELEQYKENLKDYSTDEDADINSGKLLKRSLQIMQGPPTKKSKVRPVPVSLHKSQCKDDSQFSTESNVVPVPIVSQKVVPSLLREELDATNTSETSTDEPEDIPPTIICKSPPKAEKTQKPIMGPSLQKITDEWTSNNNTSECSGLFGGVTFLLTRSSLNTSQSQPYNMNECEDLILRNGGRVIKKIPTEKTIVSFCLSDKFNLTPVYLYAVAAGIPCVHYLWPNNCVKAGMILDWRLCQLAAGRSLEEKKVVPLHCSLPLHNKHFYSTKKLDRPLEFIFKAAHAIVSHSDTEPFPESIDYILEQTGNPMGKNVRNQQHSKNIPVVNKSWIFQAIINGKLPHLNAP